ncbi:hypothetical protein MLD38_003255 [Melastoma candidum]|uniref:Uncharacterized protein n=1 Tax=Melastoma candidum TaxID=119954 RepID=A0ACB9S3C7_9MYRT|nr:hypothetical protein MLD38_003255 [Melastoma candidum]
MDWFNHVFEGSSFGGRPHSNWETESYWNAPHSATDELTDREREEVDVATALSISEQDLKGKAVLDDDYRSGKSRESDKNTAHLEEDEWHAKAAQLEEDEQLAIALQESLILEPPLPSQNDTTRPTPVPSSFLSGSRICARCNGQVEPGQLLNCMGNVWHRECFLCKECGLPIADKEFKKMGTHPCHNSCYKEHHHLRCDVCKNFLPKIMPGLVEFRQHPFWMQKYCPLHERDGTPRCCSCDRMEPRDMRYLLLEDGRKLCLECLDSAVMDTEECQPLSLEIREFFEGLNMKVEQQFPLLLVERQALNEAIEGEKTGYRHFPETRGLCLSEEQSIVAIVRRPRIGADFRLMDMITEPHRLVRSSEVTAILILNGLPRLLTGSILAHEMMHAWLRLNGYSNLQPDIEEGICQVMGHMWLESEIYSCSGGSLPAQPSSSSSTSSKKGKRSDFERLLGEFFKHQIETDPSPVYGQGFRIGNQAVLKFGLRRTLDHIKFTGFFPL